MPTGLFDLLSHCQHQPNGDQRLALIQGNKQLTYRQLEDQVIILASHFSKVGVRQGDRVVIDLPNTIEHVIAIFAVARLNAVFVNVHPQWTIDQLAHILNDCEPAVMVTDTRHATALALAKQNAHQQNYPAPWPASLKQVVVMGPCPQDSQMIAWQQCLTEGPSVAELEATHVTSIQNLAAILYTSGSTGLPKGVMLSHENLLLGSQSVTQYLGNTHEDRLLGMLPFSFDYGLNQLICMCDVGGCLVLHNMTLPSEIVKSLKTYRITGLAAVYVSWMGLVAYLGEKPTDLPALRYVTNSGGPIPQRILQDMPRVLPNTKIVLMYGLTEGFRSTYLKPELFNRKMGAIGHAIPHVQTFVVNEKEGVCGPGQQGQLIHAGKLICLGYWKQPDLTNQKIKPCPQLRDQIGDQKVLYSGDIVSIDEDGVYWFVGRDDQMIKCSGFRLSPTEVEAKLAELEVVDQVVAYGEPHEQLGQAVCVVLTLRGEKKVDLAQIKKFCWQNMPHYMVPGKIDVLNKPMPRTANGKIDRQAVVKLVQSKR